MEPRPNHLPQFYSPAEVAQMLGCSTRTVHNRIRSGEIPGRQIGQRGKFVIPKARFDREVALVDAPVRRRPTETWGGM